MRKILIIGATSAIAQETARLFAADGDRLFLVARNREKLAAVAQDLTVRSGQKIDYQVADVNDFNAHKDLIQRAAESLSGLDTVLIAHGTLSDQKRCEQEFAPAAQEFNTNFLSVVSLLTPIANRFERQGFGCIAVISSVAGDRGRQSNYVYGTAKGALTIFLQGLRNRLHKSGVHVLTIKPGFVDTPMTSEFKKGMLWVGPESIAQGIHKAMAQKKNVVYLPWFWRGVMALIKAAPERVFCRLTL
jgi:short-subunit dehydrogenase